MYAVTYSEIRSTTRLRAMLSAILLVALPWLPAETVRVALLALDRQSQNLTDLALAEMSSEQQIVFLERAEIAALKRELQLSRAGDFIPDPRLMQNAQIFALLQKNDFLAFETRTGVRLLDQAVENLEGLTAAIRSAVQKQQSFKAGEIRKLSCLPLLPVNLSEKQDAMARKIETLLLRELGNRSDTTLLERRHLLFLLQEPGAENQALTRELFAGTLALRLTALPETEEKVQLKLQFYSPDGEKLLQEESLLFQNSENLSSQCELFLRNLIFPTVATADRAGEAHHFIYEAWFAASHSRQSDALASAASASALNPEHEKELCRIAATTAQAIWDQTARPVTERCNAVLDNLALAARLAAKNQLFPRELANAVRGSIALPTQKNFASLPQDRQLLLRTILESILETRKRTLAELHRLAELPGNNWPERLFALEARVEYLHELNRVAEMQWDYSYWEREILPELSRYLDEINELLPELLRYQALSMGEKIKICSQAKHRSRRVPRFRQNLDINAIDRDLAHFFHFRPLEHDRTNQDIYRRAMELLCTSKILPLALRGRAGLLRLKLSLNSPHELAARQEQALDSAACQEFRADLLTIFTHCELLGEAPRTMHNLEQMIFFLNHDLEFKLQIQELCQRRFAWYTPWLDSLLQGHQNWKPQECRQVYEKLNTYLVEAGQDSRLAKPSGASRPQVEKYLRGLLSQLETQCSELSLKAALPSLINPFVQTIKPLAEAGERSQPIVFGYENGDIYLGEYQEKGCQIVKIATGAKLTVSKGVFHPHQIPWQGRPVPGAILKDYLAAHNGGYVFLFPKDGSEPQILDFRSYFHRRCYALVAAEDRLFLSFDGQQGYPGTVLEYNVRTQKITLLASSLDRSIEWPLQGLREPYPINSLLCDAAGKRLIMLLPDQISEPGLITYQLRLQAYFWETQKWQAISARLPIVSTSTFHRILSEDQQLWLLLEKGLGRINSQGAWEPLVLLEDRCRFATKLPNYGPAFAEVRVDYSQCLANAQKFPDGEFSNLNFTHYANRWLFSQERLLELENMRIVPITTIPPIVAILGEKYVLYGLGQPCQNLLLGVLKDKTDLLPDTP